MMIPRFLKKMAIGLALMFVAQGCALYIGEDGGFHHFHHFHHGYRGEERNPRQTQVAENRMSDQRSSIDAGDE